MKRLLSLSLLLVILITSLAFADVEKVGAEDEQLTFAIVYPIVHSFFEGTTRGAEDKAAEIGNIELIVKAPDTADASKQIEIVESLIAMGVDGIAIGPTDTTTLTPLINEAIDKGIVVLTFDSDASKSKRLGYIGTDNVSAGKHMGEVLGTQLEGKGKVLVSMGVSTQENLIQRLDGVKKVLAEKYPDIKIIDEKSSQGDTNVALANIENMVTANPDFTALIGIDAAAGPAAVIVWKAQGLDQKVITFDDTDDIIQGVRDGQITVTIAQNQYVWGTQIVEELLAACKGEEVPAFFDAGTREVNSENVAELYPAK
ncbi:MAG: substrate-binding domain-containing protein [Flexilinea sp.]